MINTIITPSFVFLVAIASVFVTGCAQNERVNNYASQQQENNHGYLVIGTPIPSLNVSNVEKICSAAEYTDLGYREPEFENIWDRLRSGYQLTQIDHPRVESYVNSYLRHPDFLPRVSSRSEPFLFYIIEQVEKRNMPLELALLPIVESAFDPFAYSHGRASGLWQFIPGTGKQYGLKQNWWYDGRRDAIAATDAALDYLEDLHQRLDEDWLLALAAYNSGEGNVRKAIRRNTKQGKATDFWSLKLPKETQAYVPQLLAVSKIILNPEHYGLNLTEIANKPYFGEVDIGSQIDLAQAASLADMDINQLYTLNAGFNRWATDPKGPHRLFIPVEKIDSFREQLESSGTDRVSWERYKVQSGDSLISIAKHFHTSVDLLKENNKIKGNTIRIGQMMLIPKASQSSWHYAQSKEQRLKRTQERSSGAKNSQKIEYTVVSGDSLWTIAKKYKISVGQLAKWNAMAPRDTLRTNQKLVIWAPTVISSSSHASGPSQSGPTQIDPIIRKVAYHVRNGDSLARIASKFNLSVNDIVRWNTVKKNGYIHPGQLLTLYVDVTHSNL